jgi:DNA repair exonuclease SbcCD ATPase subunit
MTTRKVKSFVKQFIATVQGDDVKAQAEKVYRQAESALKTQIASLEGDTISYEDKVEEAKENLSNARINNGKLITDRSSYVANLITSRNEVTEATEALDRHKKKLEFLKAELVALDNEVDSE